MAYVLKLTEEGERVLRAVEPLAKRVDARVLNALPGRQRAEFVAALRSIVRMLEGMAPVGE
jgi:MarR family transcriptional regulator, temperature-dependent positive regulator of motility